MDTVYVSVVCCFLVQISFLSHSSYASTRKLDDNPSQASSADLVTLYPANSKGERLTKGVVLPRQQELLPEELDAEFSIAESVDTEKDGEDEEARLQIFYGLLGSSTDLLLSLSPNTHLAVDSAGIDSEGDDAERNARWLDLDIGCLYSGHIVGELKSVVAINLCNSMGSILSSAGQFLLEPVTGSNNVSSDQSAPPQLLQLTKYSFHTKEVMRSFTPDASRNRGKRSLQDTSESDSQQKRTIEILVVVDETMQAKHGVEGATTYVVTVLNMVSSLFQEESLGIQVDISLSSLLFLNQSDTSNPVVTTEVTETLTNFCLWQSKLKEKIGHDHAILMTGVDMCYDDHSGRKHCNTLGFAPIGGMCSSTRSCTVNEDRGLNVAFTIAHELGHNLGMYHDGRGTGCPVEKGAIMGPMPTTDNGAFYWSACSRTQLSTFLRSSHATCLTELSARSKVTHSPVHNMLPGQVYDGHQQCKHLFGEHSALCPYAVSDESGICKRLWCSTSTNQCETKYLPAAEGTACAQNKWCRKGQCVAMGTGPTDPKPVHGRWSVWTRWSPCSQSCGEGITSRSRACNNPSPKYGGEFCIGSAKEHSFCEATGQCGAGHPSLKAQQCASFNDKPVRGRAYKWVPLNSRAFRAEKYACKLYCQAYGHNLIYQLADKVTDGTECSLKGSEQAVCIEGACTAVGCDRQIGSTARLDRCGTCSGDGSSCKQVSGVLQRDTTIGEYVKVLSIPVGVWSIQLKEKSPSPNVLAIRGSRGGYYLNGPEGSSWSGVYSMAGSKFTYRKQYYNGWEYVKSDSHPIEEVLYVEILARGSNPGLYYEYMQGVSQPESSTKEPTVNKPSVPKISYSYKWNVTRGKCSQECAGGEQIVNATCLRNDSLSVAEKWCGGQRKPQSGRFSCNTEACRPRWVPQPWQPCTQACGGGKQKRRMWCVQRISGRNERRVRSRSCTKSKRPTRVQQCNTKACTPSWFPGNWTQCSASCGPGIQQRNLTCVSGDRKREVLSASECEGRQSLEVPETSRACQVSRCAVDWYITPWTECSKTCGRGGVRRRSVQCVSRERGVLKIMEGTAPDPVDDSQCSHVPKPAVRLLEFCSGLPECPMWITTAWTKCSHTCGSGVQYRSAVCRTKSGTPTKGCSRSRKPKTKQICSSQACPVGTNTGSNVSRRPAVVRPAETNTVTCRDKKPWCVSLRQPRYSYLCKKRYFDICCQTCSDL